MKKYLHSPKKLIKHYGVTRLLWAAMMEVKRKVYNELWLSSYSQNKEDLAIEKLIGDKKVGYYIDIGAYHPTRLSNSYRFYQKGWGGVLVEANPGVEKLFSNNRPRDVFISAGLVVNNVKDSLEFYQFAIPALSTFSKKDADKSISEGHLLLGVVKLKTIGLQKIYDKIGNRKIDFMSLDIEGLDRQVLENWDFKKYPVAVICVEKSGDFTELLKNKGYQKVFENRVNTIYQLSDK